MVQIDGQTHYTRDGELEMGHYEMTIVDDTHVETRLRGIGDGCEAVGPAVSTDPAVIAFEQEKDRLRQKATYMNRPITPIFKPERKRRRR